MTFLGIYDERISEFTVDSASSHPLTCSGAAAFRLTARGKHAVTCKLRVAELKIDDIS
jgi:hypothetical protein